MLSNHTWMAQSLTRKETGVRNPKLHIPVGAARVRIQAIIYFIIISLALSSCGWSKKETRLPFDAQTWKEISIFDEQSNVRRRMAEDLVRQGTLLKKTRNEVTEMLGQPHDIILGSHENQATLYYFVGKEYSGETVALRIVTENSVVLNAYISIS